MPFPSRRVQPEHDRLGVPTMRGYRSGMKGTRGKMQSDDSQWDRSSSPERKYALMSAFMKGPLMLGCSSQFLMPPALEKPHIASSARAGCIARADARARNKEEAVSRSANTPAPAGQPGVTNDSDRRISAHALNPAASSRIGAWAHRRTARNQTRSYPRLCDQDRLWPLCNLVLSRCDAAGGSRPGRHSH